MYNMGMETKVSEGVRFTGRVKIITTDSKSGAVLRETPFMKNQVVANAGNGVFKIMDLLAGINTDVIEITHADMGTDNTAATSSDTGLGAGTVRGEVSTFARNGLVNTYRFFFPDGTTPDDTYTEFGAFMNGTPTVASGSIFNRIIFDSPLVKASGQDNTIVFELTCSV